MNVTNVVKTGMEEKKEEYGITGLNQVTDGGDDSCVLRIKVAGLAMG